MIQDVTSSPATLVGGFGRGRKCAFGATTDLQWRTQKEDVSHLVMSDSSIIKKPAGSGPAGCMPRAARGVAWGWARWLAVWGAAADACQGACGVQVLEAGLLRPGRAGCRPEKMSYVDVKFDMWV